MYILGISSYYHDSAAVLIKDGVIVCAIEEERFTRNKHDNSFPKNSINFCLNNNNLTINDIDYISYYEKPLLKFERILETFVATYPFSLKPFVKTIPEWMSEKIKAEHSIRKLGFKKKIFFVPHHYSHSSAAFYTSPFEKSAILTVDGVGEHQTTVLWKANGSTITPLQEINFPHSLGLLYSTFTAFLGFRVNDDEYKVMGMAAYGKPKYTKLIKQMIEVKPDGSFNLKMKYFAYRESFVMWSQAFEKLFGKPRKTDETILTRHKDIAASIQKVSEEIYFLMLNHLHKITNSPNLCIGGGVALNSLANGKIYQNTPFKNIYVLGCAGDSGGALGAALFTYHSIFNKKKRHIFSSLALGSWFRDSEAEYVLNKYNLSYKQYKNESELINKTAEILSKNHIIGWFQGKMEFGPRALGNRSILANPRDKNMKEKVNKIKVRELFRPFAGSVLQEQAEQYFKIPKNQKKFPFMNFCFQVKEKMSNNISAIVHKDYSCRIQTVSQDDGIYCKLIKEFYRITGIPVLLNTSFNLKGEPIVETPQQAIEDFLKTKMDYLVIGKFIVSKTNHK